MTLKEFCHRNWVGPLHVFSVYIPEKPPKVISLLLEIIRNGFLQAERVVGRRDAVADLVVAFRPFVAILLGYERVAEVEEHPGDADDAVDAADGLSDEQGDADALQTSERQKL